MEGLQWFAIDFLQALAAGLMVGGTYGLMCVGLGIIFGVMRVVNFAQGDFMMLGMYFAFYLVTGFGVLAFLGPYAGPIAGAVLAVAGGGEEAVHHLPVGVRALVGQEGVHLFRRRQEAGQVHRHPAQQRAAVGGRGGGEAGFGEPVEQEAIHRVLRQAVEPGAGHGRAAEGAERPGRVDFGFWILDFGLA